MNKSLLIFLTSFEYPSKRAHPIHGLDMARFLSNRLNNKFLFVFGVQESRFDLGHINFRTPFSKIFYLLRFLHIRSLIFSIWVTLFSLKRRFRGSGDTKILINDPRLAIFLAILKPFGSYSIIFEVHKKYPWYERYFIYKFGDKFIFITHALKNLMVKEFPRIADTSIVLPSAVDMEKYEEIRESKSDLRRKLLLPEEKFLVGYIGKFKPMNIEKGVSKIISAMKYLPENFMACLVGGLPVEIKEYRDVAEKLNVDDKTMFVPHVDPSLVPFYTKAFDLLLYVPPGGHIFFEVETSPMKLFEYMASNVPMLVSDLATTREVLDESLAFFISSNSDGDRLAECINEIHLHPEEMERRATNALLRSRGYSWVNRAINMVNFIEIK